MADITGPISSLPGASHQMPAAATCDNHPDRPAVARIQGETDSMGCELHDLCAECLAADRAYARSTEARTGTCEWCKGSSTDLSDARDYDEGLHGRVYRICGACRKRRDQRLAEEAAEDEARYGCGDAPDYDEEPF